MERKLDINSLVKIKLTYKGVEAYRSWLYIVYDGASKEIQNEIDKQFKNFYNQFIKGDYIEIELWKLFKVFGKYFSRGIDNNIIEDYIIINDNDLE